MDAPQSLPRPRRREDTLDLLATRRSSPAKVLGEPGPDRAAIDSMLTAAARTPDHGKLQPWRFLIVEGEARAELGRVAERCLVALEPNASDKRREAERTRFLKAPLVLLGVFVPRASKKIPEWEQVLSCGAACQNLLIAAHAHGFSCHWVTEWVSYDACFAAALGLSEAERLAGVFHIGTPQEDPSERARPALEDVAQRWTAPVT
jgi:nitroreductase